MKYDHVVKVNGVYYGAGQEVPEMQIGTGHIDVSSVEEKETVTVKRGRPKKEAKENE